MALLTTVSGVFHQLRVPYGQKYIHAVKGEMGKRKKKKKTGLIWVGLWDQEGQTYEERLNKYSMA